MQRSTAVTDSGKEPRRDLARRSVGIERTAGLVERGLELASAISQGAFVSVAAGHDHSLALKRDGSLWAWGRNVEGHLGLGDRDARDRPTRVGDDGDWAAVAAGRGHTVALKRDGSLWAWGDERLGALGLGDAFDRDRPTRVGGDSDWVALAAGWAHTHALKRDGSLWAWGWNDKGQLGLGDRDDRDRPTRVGGDSDWAAVAAGWSHTLALKRDGSLWACGDTHAGGHGYRSADPDRLTRIAGDSDWAAVATAGSYCRGALDAQSLALKRDGSLWGWGFCMIGLDVQTHLGRPGRIGSDSDWVAVTAGYAHALALKRDGSLWAWGDNDDSQLGLGDTEARDRPTRVGGDSDWAAVATGADSSPCYTLAIKRGGSLWAWGYNDWGLLGVGDSESRDRPTRVPTSKAQQSSVLPESSREGLQ